MLKTILAISLLASSPAWAEQAPTLVYDNTFADMTYPSVAGGYLVYSQRIGAAHQIMRIKLDNMYGSAKDASSTFSQEILRNGVALADGSFAYTSNRLGHITPWLSNGKQQSSLHTGAFVASLLPNHLDVAADGNVWAVDSTLESARIPRLIKQHNNIKLNHELVGQQWRIYHERLWAKKTGYPETKTGASNAFSLPYIFVFNPDNQAMTMLGDGFDASLTADGKSMVFVREDKGNYDLWWQNIDGTELKRLTKNTFADLEPDVSPDGQRVVFVSNRDSRGDVLQTFIHVLDLKSGKVQSITSGLGITDGGPAWLDNNTIIFHSNRNPQSPSNSTVDNWRLWQVALPK